MATNPTSTKTPRKAGARPAGGRAAKPRLVDGGAEPAEAGAEEDAAAKGGAALRLKDLVDRVVTATGGKKKGVKEIVEATLLQMGAALQKGDTLNLPAFG